MKNKKKAGLNPAQSKLVSRCPYCGGNVVLRSADGIYKDNSRNAMLYIFGWRLHGELKLGDIIVFHREERTLVKRIAAMPGDVVYICDADHTIAVNEQTETATRILTVPDGCYFVLGDNADDSFDSRYWDEVWVRGVVAVV